MQTAIAKQYKKLYNFFDRHKHFYKGKGIETTKSKHKNTTLQKSKKTFYKAACFFTQVTYSDIQSKVFAVFRYSLDNHQRLELRCIVAWHIF